MPVQFRFLRCLRAVWKEIGKQQISDEGLRGSFGSPTPGIALVSAGDLFHVQLFDRFEYAQ